MKIRTFTVGGFGGNLGERDIVELDTDRLSEADRADVERQVRDSGFFEIPPDTSPPTVADGLISVIRITDGDREHSVALTEKTNEKYGAFLGPLFKLVQEKGTSIAD